MAPAVTKHGTLSGDRKLENRRLHGQPDLTVDTKRESSTRTSKPDLKERSEEAARHAAKAVAAAKKEKPASKDGAAQRAAGEVAGLKDYQLGDCLGKGAFGSVYRALNWGTGETVAIKQIKLADLPKGADTSLQLEIDLLKNLNHANIVKYHGFVKSKESLYIILEYCENGSLHSICKNFGKFPENLVALYMSQVLHGLLYLHEQGVIHRDIKGANILTTKEGLVKLADFGVAAKKDGLHDSSVVGTPYWMAPEVIELAGATTASDIWSLGCTVIELLDGKPPYHKLQPMPALFRIVNDDHPPLPEGSSPAVRDFLMQCFQKDPNLRVSAKKLLRHPWIVSARRSDAVVAKPTKYDEAVKSVQQWNEALRSPNNSYRKTPRQMAASPTSKSAGCVGGVKTPAKLMDVKHIGQRTRTKLYQSPEDHANDNWDDDFATPIMTSALKLPHMKPHDNFAGQLSADKLKAFASRVDLASDGDNWDGNFEGDLTVRSPILVAAGDSLQTIRPYFPRGTKTSENKEEVVADKSGRKSATTSRKSSKDSLPRTQILRPAHKQTSSRSKLPPAPVRQPGLFRERSIEDYSDLIAQDDFAFKQKLAALQGQEEDGHASRFFHAADLHSLPRGTTKPSGTMRRTSAQVSQRSKVQRSASLVEIQRFAENARDEDFSDVFGRLEDSPKTQPSEHDSSSEHGTMMMLNSKLSTNSWLGDEEDDDDDPFAQLEETFDEMDLETNIARDKYARLCTLVEGLIGSLKVNQPDDILEDITEQLIQVLYESPDTKAVVVSSHGMLPILEVLENSRRPATVLRLLKVVNMLLADNVEIQENLCFVGGIPVITRFAQKKYSSDIRLEAAAFVRQIFQTSTLTLQMFVSCGGLNVLVDFLEEDYDAEPDLVLIGVYGIWSVFELQGPTPKNDFCRIFSRSNVLYPLSLVLKRVLEEEGELSRLVEARIVNIFLLFSQAENHVKETVADRMVLKRVIKDLKLMTPANQITMLKFVKNLSMLATTLETLQNSNAIEVLTDFLNASMKSSNFREISNQVLNIMYNLCRLSKERQEDAALNGLVPLLQRIVQTDRPLKEFALPILCDMAHSGRVCRATLWQNKGLQFYFSLLADQYWQVTALDAIFIWLQEETARVEEHLLSSPAFPIAIVNCFKHSKADSFENLLEPLQKLLRLSPPVAASLAHADLFSRTVHKLMSKKAVVRLNLLRIIRSIADAADTDGNLIHSAPGLSAAIADLATHDQAILVREMAGDLLKVSELNARRSMDGVRRTLRRSSSSTMATTPILAPTPSSLPPTPNSDRHHVSGGSVRMGGYFEAQMRSAAGTSSPYRPVSRDSDSGSGGPSMWAQFGRDHGQLAQAHQPIVPSSTPSGAPGQKSRLPRTRQGLVRQESLLGKEGSLERIEDEVSEEDRAGEGRSAGAGAPVAVAARRRVRRMTSQG